MRFYIIVSFLLVYFDETCSFLVPGSIQRVHTSAGDIQGLLRNVRFDGQVYQTSTFLGIPYAQPPVGNLRFRKPEAMVHLPNNPFNAMNYKQRCPQPLFSEDTSEDCLYLNVFTPQSSNIDNGPPKAVMVWIHGGGFFVGHSDLYDGGILAAYNDVIVVTLAYRLGPLGFFSTHDKNAPGNYGLWDQQLAITWVHRNIAAFGGDPNNILIFGESAGSSSVVYQTLYPGNKGLVKRAIAESGSLAAWGVDTMDRNRKRSIDFARYLGCENTGSVDMQCMRSKTTTEMKNATESFQTAEFKEIFFFWTPVFDNEFLVEEPRDMLQTIVSGNTESSHAKTFHSIDLVIGDTSLDGVVYTSIVLRIMNRTSPLIGMYGFTDRQMTEIISEIAESVLNNKPSTLSLDAIKTEYMSWKNPNNDTERIKALIDIAADFALDAPTSLSADAHVLGNASTYVYRFAVAPPKHRLQIPPPLQSDMATGHSEELPFVFGFSDCFISYLNISINDVRSLHYSVAKAVMKMWTNFAKTG